MKESGVTYAELVKRLEKLGFKETEASITMKLKRGAFAATFFLAALTALGIYGIKTRGHLIEAVIGFSCLAGEVIHV